MTHRLALGAIDRHHKSKLYGELLVFKVNSEVDTTYGWGERDSWNKSDFTITVTT
jgi:hypothetical protein